MAWTYPSIDATDLVKDSRAEIVARDEALRQCFEGASFPTSGTVLVGQLCYRSDQGLLYQCTSIGPDVWSVVNLAHFVARSGASMIGLLKLAKGTAKASASTVNLTDRTANFVHITGTTTIAALTLDAGDMALLVFDSALSITLSSSLLGPPTLNTGTLSVPANGVMLVVGEGSGVSRIVGLFRPDGYAILDTRYQLADGTRAFSAAPLVTGEGRLARPTSGTHANSGRISWGTSAPGTLQEGEIYLRYA